MKMLAVFGLAAALVLVVVAVLHGSLRSALGQASGHVPPSGSGLAASSCTTQLQIRLRPGWHIPNYLRHGSVPSDLPARPDAIDLPLFPGSTVTTRTQPQAYVTIPSDLYVHTGATTVWARAGVATAESWYRRRLSACGYRLFGGGSMMQRGVTVSTGFTDTRATGRDTTWASLSFQSVAHGQTSVELAVAVRTPPVYPALRSTLRVPGTPLRLAITQVGGLNAGRESRQPLGTVAVSNPAIVRSLAREINALPKVTIGVINCPADDGSSYRLVFRDLDGSRHVVTIDITGCQFVSAPPAPIGWLYDDRRLLDRVNALYNL